MKWIILMLTLSVNYALADESLKEKAREAMNDSRRGVQKAGRDLKDKTCELMNGKMECTLQKIKHSAQDVADSIEDVIE